MRLVGGEWKRTRVKQLHISCRKYNIIGKGVGESGGVGSSSVDSGVCAPAAFLLGVGLAQGG